MISTFTQEDLLLFIYGEAEHQLETQIKSALKSDEKLKDTYNALLNTINKLDSFSFNPDKTSLKIIMEESAITHGESLVN